MGGFFPGDFEKKASFRLIKRPSVLRTPRYVKQGSGTGYLSMWAT